MNLDHRHLDEWLDLTAQLLERPLTSFPYAEIGHQLDLSIPVLALTWEWRDNRDSHGSQLVLDQPVGVTEAMIQSTRENTNLERHPLVRWFSQTGASEAQSIGRVPLAISPRRDRDWFAEWMRPVGIEQQLSVPYQLDGIRYGAFVLSRPTDEFTDQEMELVRRLQPLMRGLHRQSQATAQGVSVGLDQAALQSVANLTGTEIAVVALLAEGHTARGIARRLGNSPRTVTKHLEHVYRKLGVSDRLTAVKVATAIRDTAQVDPQIHAVRGDAHST
jgi:DNA-binding CsgD family transcriptional regulator